MPWEYPSAYVREKFLSVCFFSYFFYSSFKKLSFLFCPNIISMDKVEDSTNQIFNLSLHDHEVSDAQNEVNCSSSSAAKMPENGDFCAICWESIALEEIALVKGCEHAYCVTCILRWAMYNQNPSCPQCKHPFQFLNIHRSLDGSVRDYMFEESVCLLLRATWFIPLIVELHEEVYEEPNIYQSEDDDEDLEDVYCSSSSSLRIGNRRWGDSGYVRAGRKEARPVNREYFQDVDAGPSRGPKKKEVEKNATGRRAKRAQKREAADKAAAATAAAKHQKHLVRLGRSTSDFIQ